MEFGISDEVWNWEDVYGKLVAPCFLHANQDVRRLAESSTVVFYSVIGPPVRRHFLEILDIKPSIVKSVVQQLDDVDISKGPNPPPQKGQ